VVFLRTCFVAFGDRSVEERKGEEAFGNGCSDNFCDPARAIVLFLMVACCVELDAVGAACLFCHVPNPLLTKIFPILILVRHRN